MRFEIIPVEGSFPEIRYGPQGRELSGFLPENVHWHPLNYGQGEGQVMIEGCEWGFYHGMDGVKSVKLHTGTWSAEQAFAFVEGVAKKIAGNTRYKLILVGEDE